MREYHTMKELPERERPYEKCLQYGVKVLSDAELLAVILRCGSRGETVSELALRLRMLLEEHGGLCALTTLTVDQLTGCRGIGTVKAIQLQCMAELGIRLSKESARDAVVMKRPDTIADYFMEDLRHQSQECVIAAMFNTRCQLLYASVITRGTVNASLVTPREVFLEALAHRAVYVVLLHNHPSGDPTPSKEDLVLTEQMAEAGKILSVPLIDHIIIGDHCYISLKEQGFIP